MTILEFFDKNYGDKTYNPIYFSVSIKDLTNFFRNLNKRLRRRNEKDLGGGIIYKAWVEDNETIFSDTELTKKIYKYLNECVNGGIESASGDDWPTNTEKDELKGRIEIFLRHLNRRKFPNGFICEKDGSLKLNGYLDKYYSDEVKKFISGGTETSQESEEDQDTTIPSDSSTDFISFLKSLQLLEHNIKNYTRLYMENSNKAIKTLLEGAFTEQQISEIFSKEENLKKFLDLGTPEQINYVIYKILFDLPGTEVASKIENVLSNKNASEFNFLNLVGVGLRIQGITLEDTQLKKLYQAVTLPEPTSIPQGLESFGKPGGLENTPVQQTSASQQVTQPEPTPDTTTDTPAQVPGTDPTDRELEIYGKLYNANYDPNSPTDRANLEQIRKDAYSLDSDRQLSDFSTDDIQAYRAQSRRKSLTPLENRFVRTGFNQFRPAVQADAEAGTSLFMQNPNPVYREFNPYVQVDRYEAKQKKRQQPQSSPTGGVRIEADGSVRRKSKLKGVAGSLSNFLGDVGNTLTGR